VPIRQLEYFSQRNKIEADATISDADKKTRVAEIDKKLAELK
jgi:phosphonate transport system substrate-binding protein